MINQEISINMHSTKNRVLNLQEIIGVVLVHLLKEPSK